MFFVELSDCLFRLEFSGSGRLTLKTLMTLMTLTTLKSAAQDRYLILPFTPQSAG